MPNKHLGNPFIAVQKTKICSIGIRFTSPEPRRTRPTAAKRLTRLRSDVTKIRERLEVIQPCFSVAVNGSAAYGFNNEYAGDLEDIDMMGAVPRHAPLNISIGLLEQIVGSGLDFEGHIRTAEELFHQGVIDIIRIPGKLQSGNGFSIHLLAADSLPQNGEAMNVSSTQNFKQSN